MLPIDDARAERLASLVARASNPRVRVGPDTLTESRRPDEQDRDPIGSRCVQPKSTVALATIKRIGSIESDSTAPAVHGVRHNCANLMRRSSGRGDRWSDRVLDVFRGPAMQTTPRTRVLGVDECHGIREILSREDLSKRHTSPRVRCRTEVRTRRKGRAPRSWKSTRA